MKQTWKRSLLVGVLCQQVFAQESIDRTSLPIAWPKRAHSTVLNARNSTPPPVFQVKAPQGAPNVVVILIDDMGFGQPSAFGGPVRMPTLEGLASKGLSFNQFHTTALCSPTRIALLTGRNHHTCNMGSITETATGYPGNTGMRPDSVAPLAEMLRLNGYATAAFGKSHETAAWETSAAGPTDRWPTRSGFDKFYGFIGGETNQWAPLLFDGMARVEMPKDPKYHFMTDMTDKAIAWTRSVHAMDPDRRFFVYFAPGATHAPHHAPQEWIDKYKGKFDGGWDKMRQETLARQIELGVVPAGTKKAPKPKENKDWDTFSADEKRLFARQMEVFSGFAEYTDHEIGRFIQSLKDTGQFDNTLLIYEAGDNGASAEGGMNGLYNEMTYFNGVQETVKDVLGHYDQLGGKDSYPHYAAGWAVAGDTPFQWTKQVASSFGGTRNPLVMSWPARIKSKGLRSQFHHVIDLAPTILEAAGLPQPKSVNGVVQDPIEGVSMLYTLNQAQAPSTHTTQYFEILGNRGIYHDGWLAGTVHRAPWEMTPRRALEEDQWELYDTRSDWSLTTDLAAKNPEKLKEMQALFLREATAYNVLPLDDRVLERMNPTLAGRPDLLAGRTSQTVYAGMTGMMENTFIDMKNRSFSISADVEVPAAANGVILCQAGQFGGWSFYMRDGRPKFVYNYLGLKEFSLSAAQPIPAGPAQLRFDLAYDEGKLGAGGMGSLWLNGKKIGEGRIEATQARMFSADEGADVGLDEGTQVTKDYKDAEGRFTGTIKSVTLKVEPIKQAQARKVEKD